MPIGWSADNSKIYLEITRTGNYEVFSINADGGSPTNLTNLPGATDVGPRGSPEGTKIVFWSNRDRTPGAPQQGGNFEIYSMNANGSGVTRLTTNPTADFNPDWSPDGKQIVFERGVTGQPNQIFRMNADGTGLTQLTNNLVGRNTQPIWSPDGRRIVFQSLRDSPPSPAPANNDVYTMNATDGSDQRRLTTAPRYGRRLRLAGAWRSGDRRSGDRRSGDRASHLLRSSQAAGDHPSAGRGQVEDKLDVEGSAQA